jgi:hypothetical protein
MPTEGAEGLSVLNSRKKVQRKIKSLVETHWPEQDFRGRLPGYRYCYSKQVCNDPAPVLLHLVIQHRRRQEQVVGFWDASYFGRHRWDDGVPPGLSECSETIVLGDSSPQGWEFFFEALARLDTDELLEKLQKHRSVQMYLWNHLHGNESTSDTPPEYAHSIQGIVKQPDFAMTKPTWLRMSDFLQDLVPEETQAESGKFTLEASVARQKMANFQLTDPQSFVVYLISGAVAGGTEKVEVYIDSDDIIVEFAGKPLHRVAMERLFSNLLSGQASPQARELAVALNAASGLNPKLLILESWDGGEGVVLEVDSEKESVHQMTDPPEGSGHRVHFRDRPSLKVLKRFLNSLKNDHPETDLVRQRCALAPVPILLDRKDDCRDFQRWESAFFSLLWEHPDHPLAPLETSHPCLRETSPVDASILFCADDRGGHLSCLVHGVQYEPPERVDLQGLYAVVCDNSATRDLSMTGLVADERWSEVKKQLIRGRDRLFAEMAKRYQGMDDLQRKEWAPILRQMAVHSAPQFETLPLYSRLDGSFWDRSTVLNRSLVRFTDRYWKHGLRSGEVVYVLDQTSRTLIGETAYQDVGPDLASSQEYFRKREEWLALEPLEEIRFEQEQGPRLSLKRAEGEVVLGSTPVSNPELWLYSLRRPLLCHRSEDLPPGVKVIVNDDKLEVNDNWTAVLEDKVLWKVVKQSGSAARDFYEMLMKDGQHTDYTLRYLLWLKSNKENWKQYARRMRFHSRLGGTVTLEEVLAQTRSSGKPMEELWEGSKRLLKTLMVPMSDFLLIQQLSE